MHDGSKLAVDEATLREEDRAQMQQGAEECLEASRKYLTVAEEILTQKTLVSHMIVRSYFTTAMILLLVHPLVTSPASGTIPDDTSLILHAMRNLEHWDVVPFMQRPLHDLKRIAQLKGLI